MRGYSAGVRERAAILIIKQRKRQKEKRFSKRGSNDSTHAELKGIVRLANDCLDNALNWRREEAGSIDRNIMKVEPIATCATASMLRETTTCREARGSALPLHDPDPQHLSLCFGMLRPFGGGKVQATG
jgi:hypothetical protein